jgi:thiamine-monophosphate kinase
VRTLGPGREFDLLQEIFDRLGPVANGLGDDCALIDVGGRTLALSIDASVEDVHFRTDWLSFEEIGWRATAAALSDLAAVGATPIGALVSLGVMGSGKRETGSVDPVLEIMGGVGACVASVGAKVLGGDLLRSEKYLVDVAVIGTVDRAVRRGGAQAGDGLWVTGALGAAGTALEALKKKKPLSTSLRARFAHPEPRISAGRWLAVHGATAMIDISDGLAGDAAHLAAASNLALDLSLERIPCWPGVEPLAAVGSGEEYELLVALPGEFHERDAAEFHANVRLSLTRVGSCLAGTGVRFLDRGRPVEVPAGWDHFAR